jgi:hypothetical protein
VACNVCRYLTPNESLAYLAWAERSVEHCAFLVQLFEACLQALPTGDSETSAGRAPRRRRYLALVAQKAAQMVRSMDTHGVESENAISEAWSLLAAAVVQFRRCVACETLLVLLVDAGATCIHSANLDSTWIRSPFMPSIPDPEVVYHSR